MLITLIIYIRAMPPLSSLLMLMLMPRVVIFAADAYYADAFFRLLRRAFADAAAFAIHAALMLMIFTR